jgi:hypothetical protein
MPLKKKVVNTFALKTPPTARDAAFGGPPRYDWMDIVRRSLCLLVFWKCFVFLYLKFLFFFNCHRFNETYFQKIVVK